MTGWSPPSSVAARFFFMTGLAASCRFSVLLVALLWLLHQAFQSSLGHARYGPRPFKRRDQPGSYSRRPDAYKSLLIWLPNSCKFVVSFARKHPRHESPPAASVGSFQADPLFSYLRS